MINQSQTIGRWSDKCLSYYKKELLPNIKNKQAIIKASSIAGIYRQNIIGKPAQDRSKDRNHLQLLPH